MAWLFQPLLMLLARSTDDQLARQVEFLHAQNAMLRQRLMGHPRLMVSPTQRFLLKICITRGRLGAGRATRRT